MVNERCGLLSEPFIALRKVERRTDWSCCYHGLPCYHFTTLSGVFHMAKAAANVLSRQERLARLVDKIKNTDTGGNSSAGFWSPKEGRSVIRILPEVKTMQYFFQTVGRHNFPPDGKKHCYCPRFTSAGELSCPVCEMVDQLYKAGDKSSKELAGQLRARKMYWMNIIVRNKDGDQGPFLYTPGVTVFQQISTLISDPDYGDIMSVEDGIDITIERTGSGLETEYQVTPRRNSSPLHSDPEKVAEWLEAAQDLTYVEVSDDPSEDKELSAGHALFIIPYDRIVREFNLDGDVAEFDDAEEEEAPVRQPAKSKVQQRTAAAKPKAEPVVEDDYDEDDEEDDEEEAPPVKSPPRKTAAQEEVGKRTARRSIRR